MAMGLAKTRGVRCCFLNEPSNILRPEGQSSAVKIESVIVVYAYGPNLLLYLQEADADRGTEALLEGERLLQEVSLNQPLVVHKGESKAFTINLNSGQFGSSHGIDVIMLLGEVAP